MMQGSRTTYLACALIACFAVGCAKKKRSRSIAQEEPSTEEPRKPVGVLEKFPTTDPVLGSKSYPLRLITTDNLAGRVAEPGPWPFVLVDARTRVEFEAEHIPGAINCPAEQVEQRLATLVTDKTREVVFYCNGPDCTKSHKAGRSAIASGFARSVVYDEGLPAWKAAGRPVTGEPLPKVTVAKIDATTLAAALKNKSMTVVDIRPRDEFLTFRIDGAVNVELDQLEAKLKDTMKPTTPICLADYTGKQQEIAARLLAKLGYTNVKVLDGGMRGWQTASMPVEKGLDMESPPAKPAVASDSKADVTKDKVAAKIAKP